MSDDPVMHDQEPAGERDDHEPHEPQDPTGELPPGFEGADPAGLEELAAAGWGEGDHEDPHVPGDLLALHVALEAREAGLL